MSELPHKVYRTVTGALRVKFECPSCGDALETALEEAGRPDTCPSCSAAFTAPGEDRYKRHQQEQARKAEERAAKQRKLQEAAKSVAAKVAKTHESIESKLDTVEKQRSAQTQRRRVEAQAAKDYGNRYAQVPTEDVTLRTIAFELNDLNRHMVAARQRQLAAGVLLAVVGGGLGVLASMQDMAADTVFQQIYAQLGFILAGGLFWLGVAKAIGG